MNSVATHVVGPMKLVPPMLLAILLMGATPVPIQQKIIQKQQQIEATRIKLEQARHKLHQARYKVQSIAEQLNATNRGIARVSASLDYLGASIADTQRKLTVRRAQLQWAKASIDRHRKALDARLKDIYEFGGVTYLDVLLSANTFTEFLERWDFLGAILRSDGRLIAKMNGERTRYQKAVAELQATENDLADQQRQQQIQRGQLAQLATERRGLLALAQDQRNQVQQQVAELENLTAAQEARLQALIQEKQREEAEAVRRARLAAWQARRAAAIAAGLPPPAEPYPGGAVRFIWPVNGPVTSAFGMRWHPVLGGYRMHTGIDIGVGYGVPIRASADGIVIYSGWYGGYGNVVIIDHGSGLSTLYAHCSATYVSYEQRVVQGQVVGAVGATGYATGPHLHFEIRVNGVPVNPLSRL